MDVAGRTICASIVLYVGWLGCKCAVGYADARLCEWFYVDGFAVGFGDRRQPDCIFHHWITV